MLYFVIIQTDNEVESLTRKLRLLEEEFEQTQTRLQSTNEKFIELGKVSDENERSVIAQRDISRYTEQYL